MAPIERVLTAFGRGSDELSGEWPLQGIDLAELQALFGEPETNPMYDCFPVAREHVERLQQAVAHPLDLERFDYFVAAYRGEGGDPHCPPRVLPAFPDAHRIRPKTPS